MFVHSASLSGNSVVGRWDLPCLAFLASNQSFKERILVEKGFISPWRR